MIGLTCAIILFNYIAFKTNTRLNRNEIAHIWTFTIAFQVSFDKFIDVKYKAYWYFDQTIQWQDALAHSVLLPPVNMMFINWYPFKKPIRKQILYSTIWVVVILIYELLTLLPEPWGYFYYGWWNIWHSAVADPILLFILLCYYKIFIKTKDRL